jgi:hypothetical protein
VTAKEVSKIGELSADKVDSGSASPRPAIDAGIEAPRAGKPESLRRMREKSNLAGSAVYQVKAGVEAKFGHAGRRRGRLAARTHHRT